MYDIWIVYSRSDLFDWILLRIRHRYFKWCCMLSGLLLSSRFIKTNTLPSRYLQSKYWIISSQSLFGLPCNLLLPESSYDNLHFLCLLSRFLLSNRFINGRFNNWKSSCKLIHLYAWLLLSSSKLCYVTL